MNRQAGYQERQSFAQFDSFYIHLKKIPRIAPSLSSTHSPYQPNLIFFAKEITMNKHSKSLTARRFAPALALLAAITVSSTSHAGWNDHYSEVGFSATDRFTNFGGGSTASEIDTTKYEKVNLGYFGSTLWAPKRGVVIPVDEAGAQRRAAEDAELRSRLASIGGWGNP